MFLFRVSRFPQESLFILYQVILSQQRILLQKRQKVLLHLSKWTKSTLEYTNCEVTDLKRTRLCDAVVLLVNKTPRVQARDDPCCLVPVQSWKLHWNSFHWTSKTFKITEEVRLFQSSLLLCSHMEKQSNAWQNGWLCLQSPHNSFRPQSNGHVMYASELCLLECYLACWILWGSFAFAISFISYNLV